MPDNLDDAIAAAALIQHDIPDEDIVAHFALMVRLGGEKALNAWMKRLHHAALEAAEKPVTRRPPAGLPVSPEAPPGPSQSPSTVDVLDTRRNVTRRSRSRVSAR